MGRNPMVDGKLMGIVSSQGEESTDLRLISKKVLIEQVPSLMQALGYYPTEKEIEDLMNEIKFDHVSESGEIAQSITIEELVKRKLRL